MIHGRTLNFALRSNQTTIYFVSNLDSSKALHWRVFIGQSSSVPVPQFEKNEKIQLFQKST